MINMKKLNASTIADDLAAFLGEGCDHRARVHSIYTHALNLLVGEDQLITLTDFDEITPMGLVVDEAGDFNKLLKEGDELMLTPTQFSDSRELLCIDLEGAQRWKSEVCLDQSLRPGVEVWRIREQLIDWLGNQPAAGLLPLLPRLSGRAIEPDQHYEDIYCRFIATDLEAFTTAIFEGDWQHALNLSEKLIGFGMGSTPSCDDFLSAYLAVLSCVGSLLPDSNSWVGQFNQTIAFKAKNRTTLISANMLSHAAQGKLSRNCQLVVQTCLFDDGRDLIKTAAGVFGRGASSGGDFLLGLVCVLDWYHYKFTAFIEEGERVQVEFKTARPVPNR